MAAPLLTKLDDPKEPGLQIVVTAFDGFLYVIDGSTGAPVVCVCVCGGWRVSVGGAAEGATAGAAGCCRLRW